MSRLMPNGRNITGQEMIWSVKCILSCPTRSIFNKSYPFYRQIGFKISRDERVQSGVCKLKNDS